MRPGNGVDTPLYLSSESSKKVYYLISIYSSNMLLFYQANLLANYFFSTVETSYSHENGNKIIQDNGSPLSVTQYHPSGANISCSRSYHAT